MAHMHTINITEGLNRGASSLSSVCPLGGRDGRSRKRDVGHIDLPAMLCAHGHVCIVRTVPINELQREGAVGRNESDGIDGWIQPPFDDIQTHSTGPDEAREVGDGEIDAGQEVRRGARCT